MGVVLFSLAFVYIENFIIKKLSIAFVWGNLHLFLNVTFIYKLQVCQNIICCK